MLGVRYCHNVALDLFQGPVELFIADSYAAWPDAQAALSARLASRVVTLSRPQQWLQILSEEGVCHAALYLTEGSAAMAEGDLSAWFAGLRQELIGLEKSGLRRITLVMESPAVYKDAQDVLFDTFWEQPVASH